MAVDPAQQDAAQRSNKKELNPKHHPKPPAASHKRFLIVFRSDTQGSQNTTVNSAILVLQNLKLSRKHLSASKSEKGIGKGDILSYGKNTQIKPRLAA